MTDPLLEVSRRLDEVLGRRRIAVDRAALATHLAGRRVLITGAGGSIGSQLAETIAAAGAEALYLVDLHENSLFRLRQELLPRYPGANLRFVLADVRNGARVGRVFDEAMPDVVFHLAAYKHVPLAEELPAEFAGVNVLGTWRLLQEARRCGVRKVVYPSTDKAVNPPSVYGATKRSVELIMRSAAGAYGGIELVVARLVNVLGAWGGVIETFTRQIAAGEAVTITDRRMTRYWITMEEALLLLTTASLPVGTGRTLLLDLGAPINVAMVAERLWAILRPGGEPLRAMICGSRPGERLAEELTYPAETLVRSDYPGVLYAHAPASPSASISEVAEWIQVLERAVDRSAGDEVRRRLFEFVGRGQGQ